MEDQTFIPISLIMKENFYLKKHESYPQSIFTKPSSELSLIVVIPCYSEPDLNSSLLALFRCQKTKGNVEVIVVINAAVSDYDAIEQNKKTYADANHWVKRNQLDWIRFNLILKNDLPDKHAGVGLARKIGMDEAVRRFEMIDKDGVIVCFDADSSCNQNYLLEIENHFSIHKKTPGCSIRFEHPITGTDFSEKTYEGIVQYELFLRYYNLSLKYAELPYSYHTVGSSMAVRSSVYQKQGGMNKRKAGEDFYFLQKIIELGNFSNLNSTCVIPSPRSSNRVPFGTGRAIGEWLENDESQYMTYNFNSFECIKRLTYTLFDLYEERYPNKIIENLPFILREYLKANDIYLVLEEIKLNSTTYDRFIKRFFRWFNAFRVLKFVHYARDEYYSNLPVEEEVYKLLSKTKVNVGKNKSASELLIKLRDLEND